MAKLPRDLSGRQVVAGLQRLGFYFLHQRGSHMILRREDPKTTISVPDHRQIRVGTLRTILHQADVEIDQLLEVL